jgi:transposase
MRIVRVEATETELELLQNPIDWRERERAETILLLAEGHTTFEVAEKQDVLAETIRERRRKWFKKGFASSSDQPRSGAPGKLSDEQRVRLREWIDAEPLTSRALINRLKADWGVGISACTLRNELKRMPSRQNGGCG